MSKTSLYSFVLNGHRYASKRAAAQALGIPYATLVSRIRAGWDDEKIVTHVSLQNRSAPVTVMGTTYPSAKVMLKTLGLDPGTVYRARREWGVSVAEAAEVMLTKRLRRAA